jgi:hypothetical protein
MLRSDELIGLVRKKKFLVEEQVSIARLRVHVLGCLSCWEDLRQLLTEWAHLPGATKLHTTAFGGGS